jgi:TPR repeat protein
MNHDKLPPANEKYIPPHRRRQQNPVPTLGSPSQQPSQTSAARPKAPANNAQSRLTPHAALRKQQRDLSTADVKSTIIEGEKSTHGNATVHRNESHQVVTNDKGIIITVNENTRNTKYDLLRVNKEKEQQLINQANKNNDHAMCQLAEFYLSGELGNKDVKKAFDLFIRAANRGNSHAMCKIAQLYERGELGEKNEHISFEWYVKAADKNNNFALAYVGQIYLSRYKQLSDEEKHLQENSKLLQNAKHYLQRGAQKGSTRAMWQLANICETGIGGKEDLPQAIKIYRDAALKGSPTSLQTLQRLVKEEKIKAEEFENILDHASSLIAKTSSDLAIDIGLEQINGNLGTNPKRGFMMLEASARKNNKDALKYLGKYYRDGIGCQADLKVSQYWFNQLKLLYEKSISLGNIESLLDLGDLYLKGAFGKIDLENAEELFIQAANSNDVDSIYYLGTLYLDGRLGNHSPDKGKLWINRAIQIWTENAQKGDPEATNSLINLFLDKQLSKSRLLAFIFS